jgi:TPR repeat protein
MQLIFGPAVSRENTSRTDTVTDFRVERLRRMLKNGWTPAALTLAEEYAASGLSEAQYLLAQMLASTGRPEDTEAAKRWYEAAAGQGHVAACKELWQRTACATSLELMIRTADLGDYQASGLLIMRHGDGQSPDVQVPNMVAYMQRHVIRGHAYAQKALGAAYDFGRFGLRRDAERAFDLYMLGARQGDAAAQCWVGICYAHGLGVKQDEEQAVHWYSEAAKRGSVQAQHNLGYSFENGRKPLTQSMQEANRWYRRAALRDFDLAQYSLGLSYLHGRALPQNVELANRWFARAAEQNCAIAQVALGYSYETGRGVDVSYSKAVELYEVAARAGDAQGQHNFAHMLQDGLGIERNLSEASRWYLAASEQGLAVAQDNLATMYIDGSGIDKDLTEAVKWRRKAAEQGLANAQYNFALMHINGIGVEKNPAEALRWCQMAAEQGHLIAQRELPAHLSYADRQRELTEARNGLSAIEIRLRATDSAYEAKKTLLVPILKPIFAQLPPSKWATAFEQAYANVHLPAENVAPAPPAPASPTKLSAASREELSHESMTVVLYELASHPGEIGISKIDPPVIDGAFFLDFSRPLRVITRRCFGILNGWIGSVAELGVPVVHQLGVPVVHEGVRAGDFLVYMHCTDPRFSDICALWRTRHPSNRIAPGVAGAGLKIIADFAVQFPQGS